MAGIGIPALQSGMPERDHLHRLSQVWIKNPLYFLTVCCAGRRPVLQSALAANIIIRAWEASPKVGGWAIGRYVIMPDHVHFFARTQSAGKPLSGFMREWKCGTASQIIRAHALRPPLWQPEFFDHVLRSADSYSEKWDYVYRNPVRAGLVATPDAWPYSEECNLLAF
jgi:REP element-mobilizing transposase RayT